MKSKMNKWIILGIVLSLGLGGTFLLGQMTPQNEVAAAENSRVAPDKVDGSQTQKSSGGTSASGSRPEAVGQVQSNKGGMQAGTSVKVEVLAPEVLTQTYKVLGKVVPSVELVTGTESSGRINAVYGKVGDRVEVGSLIYTTESAETVASTNKKSTESLNSLTSAKVAYDRALQNLDEVAQLMELGAASQSEYETAQDALTRAEIDYDNALVAYEETKISVSETLSGGQMIAPMTGIISALDAVVGELSTSSNVTIVNTDELYIETAVVGEAVNEIAIGDQVAISYGDTNYEGRVMEVSPIGKNNTDVFPIKVKVEGPIQGLKAGLSVYTTFGTGTASDQWLVSKKTVQTDEYGDFVFVVSEENKAIKTYVDQGHTQEGRVQIFGDLVSGDKIVCEGQSFIVDGEGVKIVKAH